MSIPCIKIVKSATIEDIREFPTSVDRKSWLLAGGFFESEGVWKHIDGRVAGLFSRYQDGDRTGDDKTHMSIFMNCHKLVRFNSTMGSLFGKGFKS